MAEPFVGEIRLFSFNFAPKGWAACNGQILPVAQNQALYSLIGNKFGGQAPNTFALPDLRGRVGVHPDSPATYDVAPVQLYQVGGEEAHVLTMAEMPAHTHAAIGSSEEPDRVFPAIKTPNSYLQSLWATSDTYTPYSPTPNATLPAAAIGEVGGSLGHDNMQPYLAVNFCIALTGYYPPRP